MSEGSAAGHSSVVPGRRSWGIYGGLLLLGLLFLLWRLPSMLREPGWQDEECYAVPGLTILESGIPRLPHFPSRNPGSPYFRADEYVFLEPPLFFYLQAAYYACLPDAYGTARLTSATAGVLVLLMAGRLAVQCGASGGAVLWGMGLFLMSRWFYFHATAARPDMVCTLFGLLTLLAVESWTRTGRRRCMAAAGVCIGLGGLTHPFALVYALQAAGWAAIAGRGRQRWLAPLTLAVVAIAVASAWLLLIVQAPDVFEVQFRNQFLHDKGGSLLWRILWPWEAIAFHAGFLRPHLGWWQSLLGVGGVLLCFLFGRVDRRPLLTTVGWVSLSGAWLLCGLVGPHHPVFGYFTYPAVLAFIGVGWGVDRVWRRLWEAGGWRRPVAIVFAAACVAALLPGSRIRMNLAYLQNWNRIEFNAPQFARSVIERLPPDAVCLVDEEFVLDFLVAGRKPIAFRAVVEEAVPASIPYEYRVASRSTERYFAHREWDDELAWTAGVPDDPWGCFVKVYRRRR